MGRATPWHLTHVHTLTTTSNWHAFDDRRFEQTSSPAHNVTCQDLTPSGPPFTLWTRLSRFLEYSQLE
jgi:hypothetical protein